MVIKRDLDVNDPGLYQGTIPRVWGKLRKFRSFYPPVWVYMSQVTLFVILFYVI